MANIYALQYPADYPRDIEAAIFRMIDLQFDPESDYDSEDLKAATLLADAMILADGKRAVSPGMILLNCMDGVWDVEAMFYHYASASVSMKHSYCYTYLSQPPWQTIVCVWSRK